MRVLRLILILPFLFMITALSSHQPKPQDTIPEKIEVIAKIRTDKQIDSIYHGRLITPAVDALRHEFLALRTHIDSLNARQIVMAIEMDAMQFKRDSILHSKMELSIENQRLLIQNAEYKKNIDLFSIMPNILMLLGVVVMGSLIAKGIVIGIKNVRNVQ